MTTWDVRIGPIWNQTDAESKANAFIRRHPGLVWTREWRTITPGKMSVIGVASAGRVSVPLGLNGELQGIISGQVFRRWYPYLNRLETSNNYANYVCNVTPNIHTLMGTLGSWFHVMIKVSVINFLDTEILKITASSYDDWDWGANQPNLLSNHKIESNKKAEEVLDVNYWCSSAPFTMNLHLADGRQIQFRIDARAAVDACSCNGWKTLWTTTTHKSLACFFLANVENRTIDFVVCNACDLEDTNSTLTVAAQVSGALFMKQDGFEIKFWRLLIRFLRVVNSPLLRPNAEAIFEKLLSESTVVRDWHLIFNNLSDEIPINYNILISHVTSILADCNLGVHQVYAVQLVYYIVRTIIERIQDLDKTSKAYRGHLLVVWQWIAQLWLLWERLRIIFICDVVIAAITVVAILAIIAAAGAAVSAVCLVDAVAEAEVSACAMEAAVESAAATDASFGDLLLELFRLVRYILEMSRHLPFPLKDI